MLISVLFYLSGIQTLSERRLASIQSMSQIALLEDIFSVGLADPSFVSS